MHFPFASLVAASLGVSSVFTSPTFNGRTTGMHVVRLRRGVSKKDFIQRLGLDGIVESDAPNSFAGKY